MYTLMIADNDPTAAVRLSKLVDFQALGFQLLAVACSTEEAISLCAELQPDVLISGIRAASAGQLGPLEQPWRLRYDPQLVPADSYIVLTDKRHALRRRGTDVLSKSVTAKQMTELLIRLQGRLDESKERHAMDAIYCLLDGDETLTISEWCAQLDDAPELPLCRMCTFSASEDEQEDLCASLSDNAILLRTGRDKATILYNAQKNPLPSCKLPSPCGISRAATTDASLLEMFIQSDVAYFTARFFGQTVPIFYQQHASDERQQRFIDEIAQALSVGNHLLVKSLLVSLQRGLLHMNIVEVTDVYNLLCEHFRRYVPDRLSPVRLDYRKLCLRYASLEELFATFDSCLEENASSSKLQFDEVLRMIDANYTRNLRISDLAQCFHFSTSYFSTLFRERVGVTFTQYIAQKRIALVKELLCDKELSLQQIADQAGFCDYFQFSKNFKKHTGLTPGAYRKQILSQAETE